jgi:hypothetical protein
LNKTGKTVVKSGKTVVKTGKTVVKTGKTVVKSAPIFNRFRGLYGNAIKLET